MYRQYPNSYPRSDQTHIEPSAMPSIHPPCSSPSPSTPQQVCWRRLTLAGAIGKSSPLMSLAESMETQL